MSFENPFPPLDLEKFSRSMKYLNTDIYFKGHAVYALNNRLRHFHKVRPTISHGVVDTVSNLAAVVSIAGRSSGALSEQDIDVQRNTFSGLLTAIFVLSDTLPENYPLEHILTDGIDLDTEEEPDTNPYYRALAANFLKGGYEGLEFIGEENTHKLERWADELVVDKENDSIKFYSIGFGAAVIAAVHLNEMVERYRENRFRPKT